ncbi:flippase [Prevotella sp.]|uniref:flippase n=1 Tax=Prevotella sp. TaxID=59823 RepID=UPI0025DA4526|nr:flippase [Prevotella sp.]
MSEEKVNKRIISNVFWALVGKLAGLVSALLVGVFVARYLGPTQYGVMNYAISFVTLFLVIATFGFENIEIREEAKANEQKDTILGTVFTLRLLLSLITIILISIVAYINESDLYTFGIIMVYAITVMLTPFDVIRNYFTSLVQNESIVKVGILRLVLSGIIKGVLLLVHASLIWFVISLVFDACVLAQGYCYVYKKKIGSMRSWQFDKSWACYLLRQSFPLLLSGLAATIFLQIDQIMIGNMIDKTSVGYFSVASKFVELLLYVPTILIQTVCPILVKERKNNMESYREKSQVFMNVTVWSCVLCAIFTSLCSRYIVLWTFGLKYAASIAILQILSFKIIGVALNIVSGQLLIVDEKQKYFVVRSLSGCIVCVVLNFLVISRYGVDGVAVVAIITQFIAGFLIHIFIPTYRYVFFMQMRCLLIGWKDLYKIKMLIGR